jgi:hypothetical protein
MEIKIENLLDSNTLQQYTMLRDGQVIDIRGFVIGKIDKRLLEMFEAALSAAISIPNNVTATTNTINPQQIPVNIHLGNVAPVQNNTISLETIQQKIEREVEPIRLARTLRRRNETLPEFLYNFFTDFNYERDTVYVEEGKGVQTPMGKRRSLGDIFSICKYYYPAATVKEVAKELYINLPNKIRDGYRSSYCNTINKRVFYYGQLDEDGDSENGMFDKTTNDEFGKPFRWWMEQLQVEPVTT